MTAVWRGCASVIGRERASYPGRRGHSRRAPSSRGTPEEPSQRLPVIRVATPVAAPLGGAQTVVERGGTRAKVADERRRARELGWGGELQRRSRDDGGIAARQQHPEQRDVSLL